MKIQDRIKQLFGMRRGLSIVILAAVLLELLSGAQYYFTHELLEDQLEKRAEAELTLKAILIKGSLTVAEGVLEHHLWDIRNSLYHPDSVAENVYRMMMVSHRLRGGGVCFVPDYYPSKGRLYEPYARNEGDTVVLCQLAGPEHDYTLSSFYRQPISLDEGAWVEPYEDKEGAQDRIITYGKPVHDKADNLAGVAVIDVSLEWLRDTIDRRHIYPSSFMLLLTEDGEPIIQPNEERISREVTERIITMINDSTVARKKSSSGRSTVIYFDTDERDGTVFYVNMKGKPRWQLAVVCYDDEVYAPLLYLRYRLLLLMLAAFGILLFMIYIFSRIEEKLKKKSLEQERIDGELRIANDIQQALLPSDEDKLTGVGDVIVEGRLIPAKAVGGDLYNAFIRDDKLFFCIGDVTGKGIPAAIIMAITQTLFRNVAGRESNPARIMGELNQGACRNNKSNIFITLFIGVLDLPTGHLRYCNAGHEVPMIIRQFDNLQSDNLQINNLPVLSNLPIGIFDEFSYEMQEMYMEKGDMLFLYTDGLTEAKNEQKKLLGREHVMELVAAAGATAPKALVEGVIDQCKKFVGNTEQSDDLTLLVVSYTPREEQYVLDETLTLPNDVKEVATLSSFVKDVLARLNIGKSLVSKLRLALEEAVVNVMEYAYPAGTKGDVNIRVTFDGKRLRFVISDSGISFNPTEALKADTTLSAEERPVGGLGILLVRELMDSINYERTGGKNVLTLTKTITITINNNQ